MEEITSWHKGYLTQNLLFYQGAFILNMEQVLCFSLSLRETSKHSYISLSAFHLLSAAPSALVIQYTVDHL